MAEQKKLVEEKPEEGKRSVKDVHLVHFVEEKGWAVQREGSDKVIRYFKTKKEATEYVIGLSERRETRVVFKLKNGKFQKFDNAVRALQYAKESGEDD